MVKGFKDKGKFRPTGRKSGSAIQASDIIGSAKPNGIKIMDAEKTIKGMQIRRNKRRKELGIR